MFKALIFDSNKIELFMLRQFVNWQAYGFEVVEVATSYKELMTQISKTNFDLIVIDILNLEGLRSEFLEFIRLNKDEKCFVVMSSQSDFSNVHRSFCLGIFDYIVKPVKIDNLVEVLTRVKNNSVEINFQKKVQNISKVNLLQKRILTMEINFLELLFSCDFYIFEYVEKISTEIFNLNDEDFDKSVELINVLVMNVITRLNIEFMWLKYLNNINYKIIATDIQDLNDIKIEFNAIAKKLIALINRYELHNKNSIIVQTCEYVNQNVENNIRLENIASNVFISKDYIGKLFKQKTGIKFSDYVTKVKMEHAKKLLNAGCYKNYEISEKLCYSNPDYFCRVFKDYTGKTPLDYRREIRNNNARY